MDKLISVIIPIYRLEEKFFKKCIESIINQSYRNIEIILVLDGASDETFDLCEKYRIKDNRITIYRHENQGVSVARNKGIELANGKWITFVDADDWIEEGIFDIFNKKIINNNSNFDFIMFKNYINKTENVNSTIETKYKKDMIIDHNFIKSIFQTVYGTKYACLYYCESVWKNFFNREFLLQNKITFKKGIQIGEDLLFNIDVWNKSTRGMYINEFMYHYRINENSVMNDEFEIVCQKYQKLFKEYTNKQLEINEEYSINNEAFYLKKINKFSKEYLFSPKNDMSFRTRVKKLKELCNSEYYRDNLKNINIRSLSNKRKIILILIRFKCYSLLGIFMLLFYGRKEK